MIGIVALLSVVAAEPLVCGFTIKSQCGPGAPCTSIDGADDMMILIDAAHNLYQRCDKAGCSEYTAVQSGDAKGYRTFELPGRGAFAKLGPDSSISEVVSLGSMVLVSYGQCFPQSEVGPGR